MQSSSLTRRLGLIRNTVLSIATLATVLSAQQGPTTSSLTIGGPGAVGCSGTADPPTLPTGAPASGVLDFAYDTVTQFLTLVVTNTSTIQPGIANPVVTRVALNLPQLAVTAATLVSQSSASGATPNFSLGVDVDQAPPNSLSAGCLGKYGLFLEAATGTGIGNNEASVYTFGAPLVAVGPVTFVIAITTTSTNLTAWSFSRSLPVNPPGQPLPNAAFRFKGTSAASSSDWIGSAPTGSPAGWVVGNPISGQTITLVQSGAPGWYGCMVASFVDGPIDVMGLNIPLGLPIFVLMAQVIPSNGISTVTLVVPDLPPVVGLDVLGAIATIQVFGATIVVSPDNRTFQVSDQFTLNITDEDTGS